MRDQYPLIIKSSSDSINTYKLSLLDYEVTDYHLPRGFITCRKLNTFTLYDYIYCDDNSFNGIILTCDHDYYNALLIKNSV